MTGDGGGVTNVLMVSSSVRMLYRVHTHTTNVGPVVLLDLVLVVSATSLEDGLVDTATASNDADLATSAGVEGLLGARGHADSGLASVSVVGDDRGVVAGATGELAAIAGGELDVVDGSSLGGLAKRQDVSDAEPGIDSAVEGLAGMHALGGDHDLLLLAVADGAVEDDAGQRSSTTGIVHDLLDDSADVAIPLDVVDGPVLGSSLAALDVGGEDTTSSLSLTTNNASHCSQDLFSFFFPSTFFLLGSLFN